MIPSFRRILHPTDFSAGSEVAFLHALKIATASRHGRRLTIIHAVGKHEATRHPGRFPGARATLERWRLLPPGSRREDVFNQLAVTIDTVEERGPDVVRAIDAYITMRGVDLLVLATRGPHGPPRWMRPSVAGRVARLSRTTALFVPTDARGFVAADDGRSELQRILVPVAPDPPPDAAIDSACRLSRLVAPARVEILLLRVGTDAGRPAPRLISDDRFRCHLVSRRGAVAEEISAAADDLDVDLIAMATYGHHGFLDALRGSTTERVVRRAPCPVLAVPRTRYRQRLPLFEFEPDGLAPSTA